MNRNRTKVYLPIDGPLFGHGSYTRNGQRRNERFDKCWHLFCETCRTMASSGMDYEVRLERPTMYQEFAEALQGRSRHSDRFYGATLEPLTAIITGHGEPRRKPVRSAGQYRLPPAPGVEQIRRQMATDTDPDNREYWAEMMRLASGQDSESMEVAA